MDNPEETVDFEYELPALDLGKLFYMQVRDSFRRFHCRVDKASIGGPLGLFGMTVTRQGQKFRFYLKVDSPLSNDQRPFLKDDWEEHGGCTYVLKGYPGHSKGILQVNIWKACSPSSDSGLLYRGIFDVTTILNTLSLGRK